MSAHALHNKAVCEYLLANTKFNDWVVTTAFYAALHFVQGKIFPYTEKGVVYNDIDTYLAHLKKTSPNASKHYATIKLVGSQLKEVRNEYRKLHDTCMTARYYQYKVQNNVAVDAKGELTLIEAACAAPAPTPAPPAAKKA